MIRRTVRRWLRRVGIGAIAPRTGLRSTDIPAVEAELEDLARVLDAGAVRPPSLIAAAAHMFGHRGRSLWHGFLAVADGPSAAAAQALIRPLIEAWIVLRWLELSPELHLMLWSGETERRELEMLTTLGSDVHPNLAARFAAVATPDLVARKRELVDQARAAGEAAGVLSPKAKQLTPSIAGMVRAIGALEVLETYRLAYAFQSDWTHTAAGSMKGSFQSDPVAGTITVREERRVSPAARTLAAVIFAALLADVSRLAGLAVEDRAGSLRRALSAVTT